MLVTELGIVTLVKARQYSKAPLPMFVTEFGIVTLVKPLQPENALRPMLVTEFGIFVAAQPSINVPVDFSMIALQLSRLS